MNTYTLNISTNSTDGVSTYVKLYDEIVLKGVTDLTINLVGVNETTYPVAHIELFFGDGTKEFKVSRPLFFDYKTESIINEVEYGKINSICSVYNHTYVPSTSAYFTKLALQIVLYYDNYNYGTIVVPVKLLQASYYDDIDRLQLLSTQILPLTSNNTFLNLLQSKNNQTMVAFFEFYCGAHEVACGSHCDFFRVDFDFDVVGNQ
jgi:hypothetical protein